MTDAPAPAHRTQAEDDTTHAFALGLNVDLAHLTSREERYDDFARDLLRNLDGDRARLSAVAETARATDRPGYRQAAELADLALEILETAGALDDPEAQARVVAEIVDANARNLTPEVQGPLHIDRQLRRTLRKISPFHWARRAVAYTTVRIVPSRTGAPAWEDQHIDARPLGKRYEIGRVRYRACDECRIGFIATISVDEEYQRRGIAARLLKKARRLHLGYEWCTSGQYVSARTFWKLTAKRSKERYTVSDDEFGLCEHMDMPGSMNRRTAGRQGA